MLANLVLFLFNLVGLAVGLLVGEYEVAKLRHPDASWVMTPSPLDLVLSGLLVLVTIGNLGVLSFVILRHLESYRQWLWFGAAVSLALVIVLAVVLGDRFLPILWPMVSN
jgi:hypothetical protein